MMDVICLRQTTQQNPVVQWIIYSFFESEFLNLFSSYEFMMNWKQYHNNVFYAGQRGNYLCTQQCFLICQSIWPTDMSYYTHVLPCI